MLTKITKDKTRDQNSSKSSTTKNQTDGKWLVIKSGAGKGMSVPEYFIKKPRQFFEVYLNDDNEYDDDGSYESELDAQIWRVMGYLKRIRVLRQQKKMEFLTANVDRGARYSLNIARTGKSYLELFVDGTIRKPSAFRAFLFIYKKGASASEFKHVVDYALSEVVGKKRGTWDRAQCEWFFSADQYFVADCDDRDDDDYDD